MSEPGQDLATDTHGTFSVTIERRPGVARHMLDSDGPDGVVIIHIDPRHTKTETGTRTRMGFPILLVSGWVDEPEEFARKVAALLEEHQP